MKMGRITPPPFGDDDDANRAVCDPEVLENVGKLSVESRRLARSTFKHQAAFDRQHRLVRNLYDLVAARARSLFVDEAAFREAARAELERRLRRPMPIDPLPPVDGMVDPEQRRLQAEYADAVLHEQAALRRLNLAREKFTDAHAGTLAALRALDQHKAKKGRGL